MLREATGLVTVDDAVRALRVERRDAAKLLALAPLGSTWLEPGAGAVIDRREILELAADLSLRDSTGASGPAVPQNRQGSDTRAWR